MNLSDEIRQQIEKNKGLKLAVGEINNHLSILEELVRKDIMEQVDEAYQKGFEDGKAVHDKGCEGCKYGGSLQGDSPCFNCSNYYKNNWTAKDDKFEFGDEIIDLNGVKGCVISKDNEEGNTMYALFGGYRVPQCICQRNYRKTGKHYDIEKLLLEAMQHD